MLVSDAQTIIIYQWIIIFDVCRLFDTDRSSEYISELDRIMGFRVPAINI